ncbi:bifunctional DNA primase/polymerase [Solemya velum gill symbiont]|nr:bifunctional DNA primase/polymerase [Solemya velum gill symbiont]OOY42445.1 hypothetical protein BOV92_13580 [Solemya velum gill symbiont]
MSILADSTYSKAIAKAAHQYIDEGFALVPIAYGTKRPVGEAWNKKQSVITTHEQLDSVIDQHDGLINIGLAHRFSHTCAIDIDDYEGAVGFLEKYGIDLDALLTANNAVQIVSGRDNRAKLL